MEFLQRNNPFSKKEEKLPEGKWIKTVREEREKKEGNRPLIYDNTPDPEEGHVEMSHWPWSKKTVAPTRRNSQHHSLSWKDRWNNLKDTVTDQFNPTPDTRACGRLCCCKPPVAVVCCVGVILIVVLILLIIVWKNKSLFLLM